MSVKFLVKVKIEKKAKSECWSEWSYTGVVLLAGCSIRQGLSEKMTYRKPLNEKGRLRVITEEERVL